MPRDGSDGRLDPVRWRRPTRATFTRLAIVAALLVTAALAILGGRSTCGPAQSAPTTCDSAASGSAQSDKPTASGKAAATATGSSDRPADNAATSNGSTSSTPAGSGPAGSGAAGSTPAGSRISAQGSANGGATTDGRSRLALPAGTLGVPIRLAEPTALALVRPGDRVDLLRVPDHQGSPATVAEAALVISVTGADDPTLGGLLLALTPAQAHRAVEEPGSSFAVLVRPG
jgi:hypothetical protein